VKVVRRAWPAESRIGGPAGAKAFDKSMHRAIEGRFGAIAPRRTVECARPARATTGKLASRRAQAPDRTSDRRVDALKGAVARCARSNGPVSIAHRFG
jgi:hypothetical protein